MLRLMFLLILAASAAVPQHRQAPTEEEKDLRLPNGRSQKEEILKADHAKTLKDAGELLKAAEDLKAELEKNDRYVLSLTTLKQLDEIEKLAKRIRSRIKH